jgi:periplasmic divalent cation tolerance protein
MASDLDGGDKRVALTVGQLVDVEITAPDAGWLVDFTRRLISDRLVASGNIAPVRSVYRWGGTIEDRTEHVVVLHTQRVHLAEIIERTLAEHPYEVPGLRVAEVDTHPAYAAWVVESTS